MPKQYEMPQALRQAMLAASRRTMEIATMLRGGLLPGSQSAAKATPR